MKKIIIKKPSFIKLLNIILIVITLCLILNALFNKDRDIFLLKTKNMINTKLETILNTYHYNNSLKGKLKPYLEYLEYSKNDVNLNGNLFINSLTPKISVVISLYNRQQYIKSTIKSIQNQNLIDIEIVIIDDCSKDNSTKYIKTMQKRDQRIILLQNKENMGTLYSKSIGVLYSKGQFIQSLDSDDMLCNQNYLSIMYDIAIKNNYDYLTSKSLYISDLFKFVSIYQPFPTVIWSKLIKRELYIDSIFKIGINLLKMKVVTLDDDIIALYMFRKQKGVKINIIGIAHYTHGTHQVFVNAFKSEKTAYIFCKNIITTIRSFYMLNDSIGFIEGKWLLDKRIIKGPCSPFINKDEIKDLIRNNTFK